MEKNELLTHITDYLKAFGVHDLNRHFRCLNPAHADRHPSMSFDKNRNRVHCFACGADYDLIDLIAIRENLSAADAFREARRLYDPDWTGASSKPAAQKTAEKTVRVSDNAEEKAPQSIEEYLERCHAAAGETNYFAARGIDPALIETYNLGYDRVSDCVVLPCGKDGFIRRMVQKKRYLNQKGRPSPLFNTEKLDGEQPVFIVEGYFDALAVESCGYHAVALNGAANAAKLAGLLQARTGQETTLPPVLLLPDRDEAGEKWAERLLRDCAGLCVRADELPEGKDFNELLLIDRQKAAGLLAHSVAAIEEKQRAEEAAAEMEKRTYLESSIGGAVPYFLAHIRDLSRGGMLSTGFPVLDRRLDGGLYEGLYVLGAVSSLGKTALMMQIADNLAAAGQDVLFFSLEMSVYELMARSVSRESFQNAEDGDRRYAKTARGILDGRRYLHYSEEERRAITKAIIRYTAYADHLYIREGDHETSLADIENVVKEHIRLTGSKPVVMLDYLQILAPIDVHFSDKQNVDKSICGLKKLSRSYGLTVFAVSSFNREHYGQAATMAAFKESGGIDYSADVLLGLQARGAGRPGFDVEEEKRKDPRELALKILKNRSGPMGEPVPMRFYPGYSYITDEEG